MNLDRRHFLDLAAVYGTGLCWLSSVGCRNFTPASSAGKWRTQLLQANDLQLDQSLRNQNMHADHPKRGGIPDAYGICHAGTAAGFIQQAVSAWISSESAFYHSEILMNRMNSAIDFLLNEQHDDGTIDLLTTNFHSTPDTAFVAEPLALALKILMKDNNPEKPEALTRKIDQFLQKAGAVLTTGGIHTPNHRWVVCMALSRIQGLNPDQNYLHRIEEWLAEGIDIDSDGQYTERSTAVYSPLTNRCLITISRLLNKPELLEPVRRNLEMTLYLVHPNGELVTEISRRQDQYQARQPVPYYYPYLYMGYYDANPTFTGMARQLEILGASALTSHLAYLLEDEKLLHREQGITPPETYHRYFPGLACARFRSGSWDATILGQNSTFFTLQHGSVVLQAVRLATAFFGKGQFKASTMEVQDGVYVLHQKLEGPYYQPLSPEQRDPSGSWEATPRENRRKSELQLLDYRLQIRERGPGFLLEILVEGTDDVPLALELSFRKGGTFHNLKALKENPDCYLFDKLSTFYEIGTDRIYLKGGQSSHQWTSLRGAEERIEGTTAYITGFTPFRHELWISVEKIPLE